MIGSRTVPSLSRLKLLVLVSSSLLHLSIEPFLSGEPGQLNQLLRSSIERKYSSP